LQLDPWPGYTGMPIGGDQILTRGLTGGEGKVRGKVQELMAVTRVAGVGEEKGRGGESSSSPAQWSGRSSARE
jgi:hypothetical protein